MTQTVIFFRTIDRFKVPTGVMLCLAVALFLFAETDAQEEELPDPRFGVAEAFWAPEEALELGVGWERILFYWKEIQPAGPNDWNTLHVREEWLAEADASGREVVGLLKNTAIWASEDGTEAGKPRGLELPIEDPGNYWANYTRRIAQYYSPLNVHRWIIWNEPEITSDTYGFEFAGSVEEYYRLLKVAYLVIKEVDPEASIHLAGVTWWHDQSFLRRLFDVAASDPEAAENDWFFDVISLHIYFRPDTVLSIVQEVQNLQAEFGMDKRIWLNETNAPPNRDPLWPVDRPAFHVDLDQQAWFIIQATVLALSEGTERVAVYKLADVMLPEGGEAFGMLRQDSSRRPAYDAYAATIDHLENFSEVSLKQHPHYYVATFTWPDKVTRIAWSRISQSVTVRMPALSERATLVNYLGESVEIAPIDGAHYLSLLPAVCHEECLIGGAPYFIVDEGVEEDILLIETAVAVSGIQPTPVEFATVTPYPTVTATSTPLPTSSPTPLPSITPQIPTRRPTETVTATPTEAAADISGDNVLAGNEIFQSDLNEPTPDSSSREDETTNAQRVGNYSGLIFLALAAILLLSMVVIFTRRRA